MMVEQKLRFEEAEKIFFDEEFTALTKKLSLNDEIRMISLEKFGIDQYLNERFEKILNGVQYIDEMEKKIIEKVKEDPYIKTAVEKINHNFDIFIKITQDEDFKALMTKYEVNHKYYILFAG